MCLCAHVFLLCVCPSRLYTDMRLLLAWNKGSSPSPSLPANTSKAGNTCLNARAPDPVFPTTNQQGSSPPHVQTVSWQGTQARMGC